MTHNPPVSLVRSGLFGKCPRCGAGALFKGYLALQERCGVCDLDFSKGDAGDGPAVFAIFIVGFFAAALAFVARFVWFVSMLWALAIASLGAVVLIALVMRPLKATLIALQYRHGAEEGRPRP